MEFNNLSINSISYKSYKEKINNLKMEIHDCLERANEIINNLGLVPDSSI